ASGGQTGIGVIRVCGDRTADIGDTRPELVPIEPGPGPRESVRTVPSGATGRPSVPMEPLAMPDMRGRRDTGLATGGAGITALRPPGVMAAGITCGTSIQPRWRSGRRCGDSTPSTGRSVLAPTTTPTMTRRCT